MDKPLVYISGPISKIEDGNKKAFYRAHRLLEMNGNEALNPHEICSEIKAFNYRTEEELWAACMKACIKTMMDADLVVMLEGWEHSKGAKMEKEIAERLGIKVMDFDVYRYQHAI